MHLVGFIKKKSVMMQGHVNIKNEWLIFYEFPKFYFVKNF
jgi:hypothetical protein